MKAADLIVSNEYVLEDDRRVTVLDNVPVPDGQPNQRKVLVVIDGEEEYVLPRQIIGPAAPRKPLLAAKKVVRRPFSGLDDPRLDHFRPDPSIVNKYVSRRLANGQTDLDYLMECWRRRENVVLVGDTQGGKTMVVLVMAVLIGKEIGLGKPVPVFTLSASNGVTDFDLFGQPTAWTDPDGEEHIVWLPGLVDLASRCGGILLGDEINMMPERVTSSLHPIADWRRQFVNRNKPVPVPGDGFMPEIVNCSPDLWFVATMNPNYRGAGALNEAFANRFRHILWEYEEEVERNLVTNTGALALGEALRQARATGHINTPVGTAALMRLAADVERDGVDMALFCLKSMFPPHERPYIEEIVESRSFAAALTRGAASNRTPSKDPDSVFDLVDEEQPF